MRNTALFIFLMLLLGLSAGPATVPAIAQEAADGEIYTVQSGDWLSKIAEKYYGDAGAYPTIIEATNARAAEDGSFAAITNPDLIGVGQRLWIPVVLEADAVSVEDTPFVPVTIDDLGIQVLVPRNWPRVNDEDPLFKHAWRAGLFGFVSFASTPGNDALTGLARLLGRSREDLAGGSSGGQLAELQFDQRTWTVFKRDESGRTAVGAATVQDKVVYQVSLSSESSQSETLLNTILQSFQVVNPGVAQQAITIDRPAPGTLLTYPFELRGTTSQYPFQGRLVYRVLDGAGNQVGRAFFEVVGQVGNPSTFAFPAVYSVQAAGPGTVEVAEISAADGAILAIDSVGVILPADPDGYGITIDDPRPYVSITSPVQIRGKTSNKPFGGTLRYRIIDAAGQEISQGLLLAVGQAGQVNAFEGFAEFYIMRNGPGRVEVFDINPADGSTFALGTVNVWLTLPR